MQACHFIEHVHFVPDVRHGLCFDGYEMTGSAIPI